MMPLTHRLALAGMQLGPLLRARNATAGDAPAPGPPGEQGDTEAFIFYLVCSVCLVAMAGLMSGLTLGLMSLDMVDLEILRRSGTARQKQLAEKIMPVLRRPHVLLVTLLLCNAAAAESLPLFLDRMADPVTAVLVSVTVVLLFGEIIPQAACKSYGLQIGAYAAPFVQLLIWLTAPISYPIGWVLDRVLGEEHSALFRRAELKALVDIHREGQEFGGHLTADEVTIIKGALDMSHKTARQAMTPVDMVFMLPADAPLDKDTLTGVLASGHSRIPVHKPDDRSQVLGILLVKELILVNKDQGLTVGQLKIRSLPYMRADTPLYDMLRLFEIGRSHMAILVQLTAAAAARRQRELEEDLMIDIDSMSDDPSVEYEDEAWEAEQQQKRMSSSLVFDPSEVEPVGVITIEDVLEELLSREIVDETDQFIDNMHLTRVNAALLARGLPPHLREALQTPQLLPRVGGAEFMRPTLSGQASLHEEHAAAAAAGGAVAAAMAASAAAASAASAAVAAAGAQARAAANGGTVAGAVQGVAAPLSRPPMPRSRPSTPPPQRPTSPLHHRPAGIMPAVMVGRGGGRRQSDGWEGSRHGGRFAFPALDQQHDPGQLTGNGVIALRHARSEAAATLVAALQQRALSPRALPAANGDLPAATANGAAAPQQQQQQPAMLFPGKPRALSTTEGPGNGRAEGAPGWPKAPQQLPLPPRRSRNVSQGIRTQMDLLQPLLDASRTRSLGEGITHSDASSNGALQAALSGRRSA